MASTYSTDLKLELMVTGENAGTWGDKTNTNLNLIQQAVAGYQAVSIAGGAQTTALVMSNATLSNARNAVIALTGTITGNQIVTVPDGIEKTYIINNNTTGAFTVQFKTVTGTGPTFSTTDKSKKIVYSNGVDVIDTFTDLVTQTGTQTLTNKRIDPRVSSTTSASSLTPDIASYDVYAYTALAAGLTINAPTGTPVDGNKLIFRILDNGTSRALTWNATYTAIGVTLPTATTVNKITYVGCIYNTANTRWDAIAVTTQA